jgi:hypothetical protein
MFMVQADMEINNKFSVEEMGLCLLSLTFHSHDIFVVAMECQ